MDFNKFLSSYNKADNLNYLCNAGVVNVKTWEVYPLNHQVTPPQVFCLLLHKFHYVGFLL